MMLAYDQSCFIKDCAVCLDLFGDTAEGVLVALDLKSQEMAVDDGDVRPASAMLEAQFVDHERIGSLMMLAQFLAVKTRANLSIVHGRPRNLSSWILHRISLSRGFIIRRDLVCLISWSSLFGDSFLSSL